MTTERMRESKIKRKRNNTREEEMYLLGVWFVGALLTLLPSLVAALSAFLILLIPRLSLPILLSLLLPLLILIFLLLELSIQLLPHPFLLLLLLVQEFLELPRGRELLRGRGWFHLGRGGELGDVRIGGAEGDEALLGGQENIPTLS